MRRVLVTLLLLLSFLGLYGSYIGPSHSCNHIPFPSLNASNLEFTSHQQSGWCSQYNIQPSRPLLLSDFPLLDSNTTFEPLCDWNLTHPQYSICRSVVGIRYNEFFNLTKLTKEYSYLLVALESGEVFMMDFNTYSKSILKPSDSTSQLLAIEGNFVSFAPSHSFYITISRVWSTNATRITVIKQEQLYSTFEIDSSLQYIQCKASYAMQKEEFQDVILCLMKSSSKHHLLFYNSQGTLLNTFLIYNSEHVNLQIEMFTVKSDFVYSTLYTWIDTSFVTNFLTSSSFVLIYDTIQVRLLYIPFSMQFSSQEMNWKEVNMQTTLFKLTETSQQITSAQIMTDVIRKPLKNDNCSQITLHPSQNVFLLLGIVDSQLQQSKILTHHVMEFAFLNASLLTEVTNPLLRNMDCGNGFFNLTSNTCQANEDTWILLQNVTSPIRWIQQRFVNTNFTMGMLHMPSFEIAKHSKKFLQLNLFTVCETFKQYNSSFSLYVTCMLQVLESTQCEFDMFCNLDSLFLDVFFQFGWKNEIIVATEKNELQVISMLYQWDRLGHVQLEIANQMQVIGDSIRDVHLSTNAQHLFVTVTRPKWQLDSQQRYVEICQLLQQDPDNLIFKNFSSICKALPANPLDLSLFVNVFQSCALYQFCPSLSQPVEFSMQQSNFQGYFYLRSNIIVPCPKGYFCRSGMKLSCLPGFLCTQSLLALPQPCVTDSWQMTCFDSALSQPKLVLPGTISVHPQFAPIAAPPGYFFNATVVSEIPELETCQLGQYCPFARQITNQTMDSLLCPKFTFCNSTNILLPQICTVENMTQMNYCPAGTFSSQHLCPAGYYCPALDQKISCNVTQYCPMGSLISMVCPAGYYCPNASLQIECPKGYFCRAGSVQPQRCQWFNILNQCPGQTEQDRTYLSAATINLTVAICFGILYWCLMGYWKWSHQRQEKKRKETLIEEQKSTSEFSKFRVHLRFENLGLKLRTNGRLVLQNITGEFPSGSLICVMGCSGSGKSTFITTLANRAHYGIPLGKVFVNHQQTSLSKFNSRLGFVPQDDIMLRCMTVEETLLFAAKTRLDSFTPLFKIQNIVDQVIDMLKLNKVRHQVIGDAEKRGISGGELKRVNVGMELVSLPSLLLCDEPTSGLDSYNSIKLIEALRNIAQTGVSVVAVIHQPRYEIFEMFDYLLLLEEGETVYFGKCNEAVPYFESLGYDASHTNNPADFLLDLTEDKLNKNTRAQQWREYYANLKKEDTQSTTNKIEFKKPRHWFLIHFIWSLQRALVQQFRDWKNFFINMLLLIIAGLLMGIVYNHKVYKGPPPKEVSDLCPGDLQQVCSLPQSDPIISSSAMMVLAIALCGGMAALNVFGKEHLIFQRESQQGVKTVSYFMAKDISQLPMVLLAPILFLSVYYFAVSPRASLGSYYLIVLLLYWSSFGLSYIVSIVSNSNMAQLTCVVVIFIFNIFSGQRPALPEYKQMPFPMPYVPYFSYLRYCLEALYLNELVKFENIYDISTSLSLTGYAVQDLQWIYYVIIAYGLLFRFIALICLYCSKPNSLFNFVLRWISPAHIKHLFKECVHKWSTKKAQQQLDETNMLIVEEEEETVSINS